MNFLVYIFGFLTLILIITAIHEAGHYSMARFFKVTILDFSIGMGKSLKSWKDKADTAVSYTHLTLPTTYHV